MNNSIKKDLRLSIDGIGIVIYSNKSMINVAEGSDFFLSDFSTPKKVAEHIQKGDIVGFCTGSSGDYKIKIREGYPDEEISEQYPISIRLAIDVKGNAVSIIDLAWLMEWSNEVPIDQQIYVDEGYYHLTILTRIPDNGVWGSNQIIYIYMKRIEKMPQLKWDGVPQLFIE